MSDKKTAEYHVDLTLADRLGFNPYYYSISSGLDDPLILNDQEMIDLASNNYLGLATDHRVKSAMKEAIDKYGASMCGTPIATGYIDSMKKLESRLAGWLGLEDALIFPSCYQLNSALFSSLGGKEDLTIIDHFAHASLIHGVRAANMKIMPFLHNNMEHLKKLLAKSKNYRRTFIVTESVFSTEGSIAPLDQISRLANEHNATCIVDDSHGLGVLGNQGKGILEEKGITGYAGIYTASLGKAFANLGGVLAGKKELITYLRYSCPAYIYSTALPPSTIAGVEKVLEIIQTEFKFLKEKLVMHKKILCQGLEAAGCPIVKGEAPITSIDSGSMENTIRIARDLFRGGVLSTPFVEPSVPQGKGKVRLIARANLSEKSVQKATEIIRKLNGWNAE